MRLIRETLHAMALLGLCAACILTAPTPAMARDTAASPGVAHPLTSDSSIAELLDNPAARQVLEKEIPAMFKNPQIEQARGLTLRALQAYVPNLLTDDRLRAIDTELAHTPGAVSSADPRKSRLAAPPPDPRIALELKTLPLWPDGAPDALGKSPRDIPAVTFVGPDGAPMNGTAVIIAPGGSYQGLATGLEGRQVADWFAAHGVVAFILTYRLASAGYRHPVQLHDAQRAIRWVRTHAQDYGISADRIGIVGFSAGGHLAAMTETLFDPGNPQAADPVDRVSSRPDFAVLAYAATDRSAPGWNAQQFIVTRPDAATLRQISPVENVTAQTPPTFIYHTTTDELVDVDNALTMYRALKAANVPVEMHIFAQGRHGGGLGMTVPSLSIWPTLLQNWLAGLGLLSVPGAAR